MKKQIWLMSVVVSILMIALSSVALAHQVDSQEPVPVPSGVAQGNLGDAVVNSDGNAANSFVRNPVCGAHSGPNGIHPPGNP